MTERKNYIKKQTNTSLDVQEAECRHPNKMSRSLVQFPALSQVLYSESIPRDRDARHQQGGPSYHHSNCRSPSGLGGHMVIAWGKCTLGREATPTFIRSYSGTVIMSSSLKHRHGPPVITVVPEVCVRNTHLSHVLPTGVSPIHWSS